MHKVVSQAEIIILTQIRYSLAAPRGTVTLCASAAARAVLDAREGMHVYRRGSIASRMRKFTEVKAETYRADRTRLAA